MLQHGQHTLDITQARYVEGDSHENQNATDLAGGNTGIQSWNTRNMDYKVTEMLMINDGNGMIIQSCSKVKFRDGTSNYITLLLWHDNDVSNMYVGKYLAKNTFVYQEGTSGNAYGNHIHFEISTGKVHSDLATGGAYHLPSSKWKNFEQVFYILDTTPILRDGGLKINIRSTVEFNGTLKLLRYPNEDSDYSLTINKDVDFYFIDGRTKAGQFHKNDVIGTKFYMWNADHTNCYHMFYSTKGKRWYKFVYKREG